MVGDQEVTEVARRGDRSIAAVVETGGILTVRTDTPLSELFAPSKDARVPLAVVDEDFHLMGVISRIALLDSMSRSQDAGDPVGLSPVDQTTTAATPAIEKEA